MAQKSLSIYITLQELTIALNECIRGLPFKIVAKYGTLSKSNQTIENLFQDPHNHFIFIGSKPLEDLSLYESAPLWNFYISITNPTCPDNCFNLVQVAFIVYPKSGETEDSDYLMALSSFHRLIKHLKRISAIGLELSIDGLKDKSTRITRDVVGFVLSGYSLSYFGRKSSHYITCPLATSLGYTSIQHWKYRQLCLEVDKT